jgi:prepilin-type N-terminal cleavage/methylation domain-containing protein
MKARLSQLVTRTSREGGFTLIEVLVTLALLAFVLVLTAEGVRYARATWKAAARLDQHSNSDVSETFLRARLAEAMPVYEQRKAGVMRVLFQGTREAVSFVAPAPNGPVGAGLYRYVLEAAAAAPPAQPSLIVKLVPHQATLAEAMAEPRPDRHVLVRNIKSVSFRYFGRGEIKAQPAWHSAWTRTDAMPSLVEIAVARDDSQGGSFVIVVELRLQPRAR